MSVSNASHIHKNEPTLRATCLVLGTLLWLLLLVGTLGIVLIYVPIIALAYLFAQSGLIAHLRGNAVELSARQLSELHRSYLDSCALLGIDNPPTAYVLMGDGLVNAMATRFLRRHYVIVFSGVVDALHEHPAALRFYFGHELGHIARGHLQWRALMWPAMLLPLLGAATRRAEEYTCDLHGLACCESPRDAELALAVLASGGTSVGKVDARLLAAQSEQSGAFWMSFHELSNDYPWLSKRLAQVHSAATGTPMTTPRRHIGAWVLAALVPRLGFGASGAVVWVFVLAMLAAISLPAYQDYLVRAQVAKAEPVIDQVTAAATPYVETQQAYPDTLDAVGLTETVDNAAVERISLDGDGITLLLRGDSAHVGGKTIVLEAYRQEDGSITWACSSGTLDNKYRSPRCRE